VVCGPRGFWARFVGAEHKNPPDVRHLLSHTRHWMAFFSLWTSFLARRGWTQSVDLEAWHAALEMGKAVRGMESLPEQIETLESIPIPRIVNFIRSCRHWQRYIKRNVRAYLKGDVDNMFGTSIEFPTRTELVIHRRDARCVSCSRSHRRSRQSPRWRPRDTTPRGLRPHARHRCVRTACRAAPNARARMA